MDLVVIPHALMVFYGGLVLACGGVLGFIAGRNAVMRALRDPALRPGLLLDERQRLVA